MAGIVEKVAVKVGQKVSAGDLLCVVSAMKMEVHIRSDSPTLSLMIRHSDC